MAKSDQFNESRLSPIDIFSRHWQSVEARTLDPGEDRRQTFLALIQKALPPQPLNSESALIGGSTKERPPWTAGFFGDDGVDDERLLMEASQMLAGVPRWQSPFVAHNVNPAPMMSSVAASASVSLYNPNMLWDFVSGGAQDLERIISEEFARLLGWNEKHVSGAFCFGGKGCMMYAVRLGVNRCFPGAREDGLSGGQKAYVVAGAGVHYALESVCGMLGLGSNACIRVATKDDDTVDPADLCSAVENILRDGRKLATIVLSGGNTLDLSIDPIAEIMPHLEHLFLKYKLDYRPFIYLDAVLGWPWLLFRDYDSELNNLGIPRNILDVMIRLADRFNGCGQVDGVGLDFHKLGLAPYDSSLFVSRQADELLRISNPGHRLDREPFGNNFTQHYTIEHTRSAAPVVSAWCSLRGLGRNGVRSYISRLWQLGQFFREKLPSEQFEHVNYSGYGWATLFWPKGAGGVDSFDQLRMATESEISLANSEVFSVFEQLAFGENGREPIILRYLPQYSVAACGLPMATLVYFPMALAATEESTQEVIGALIEARSKRTHRRQNSFAFAPPLHVPK